MSSSVEILGQWVTLPDPDGQFVLPSCAFRTTGSSTSWGLFGLKIVACPLAVNWTIALSGSQLVMRWSMPCLVGPVFWPVFTGIVSPTETSQTSSAPLISLL